MGYRAADAMLTIRSRRDLALLLEKQMTAASTRAGAPSIEEDIEQRTALKTYLLEAHGRMRSDPLAALRDYGASLGITVEATPEPDLFALTQGELQLWIDTGDRRVCRLYSVGPAKDTDRVHLMLVSGSGLLECVWLPPRSLEQLARGAEAKMVLFSLRHDRRALRRTPDEHGIDSVTLRFWGPRARQTLDKLRHSDVLPGATSVFSVRVRLGDDERYCLAEVFHSGKVTAVGTSFAEHEKVLKALVDEHVERTTALEQAQRTPRRIEVPVQWTVDDLGFAVGRMFSGAEPFRMWGVPEAQGDDSWRVRACDLDVGRTASFIVHRRGVSLELNARTPASTTVRFLSALQYHVNADLRADVLEADPLLQLALPPAVEGGAFRETSALAEVARATLVEACAAWVRGGLALTTSGLVEQTHGRDVSSPALHDLTRQVMSEAAAHEWRPWLRLVAWAEGRPSWRFADPPPTDATARLRELGRLNRAAQQLCARLAGTEIARWLQLSLFGAESLVAPMNDPGEA